MYINSNTNLAAVAEKVFGYRGRKFQVKAVETVRVNSHWDGGSRSYYATISDNGRITHFGECGGLGQPPTFTLTVTPQEMVLEHNIFCGQETGVTFLVHPSVFPKYLPDPELSWAEQVALVAARSLKSSYAGDNQYRRHEAVRTTGITSGQYREAVEDLIAKGLLNKAGAITPAGRNAAGEKQLHQLAISERSI